MNVGSLDIRVNITESHCVLINHNLYFSDENQSTFPNERLSVSSDIVCTCPKTGLVEVLLEDVLSRLTVW